jgi:hypothetical protein
MIGLGGAHASVIYVRGMLRNVRVAKVVTTAKKSVRAPSLSFCVFGLYRPLYVNIIGFCYKKLNL